MLTKSPKYEEPSKEMLIKQRRTLLTVLKSVLKWSQKHGVSNSVLLDSKKKV